MALLKNVELYDLLALPESVLMIISHFVRSQWVQPMGRSERRGI